MKQQAVESPPDLIPGLLPSSATVIFAGPPGVGKSFTTLSWAAAVASGTPWFGRDVGGPKPVVYVLGEGWSRFGHRVAAWEHAAGVAVPKELQFINGSAAGISLSNADDIAAAVEVFAAMDPKPALIIFDTLAMLSGIINENDNGEAGRALRGAEKIVATTTGASVVMVHHVTKETGRVRGASSLRGNVDSVIVAMPDANATNGTFWMSTEIGDDGKQRDGAGERINGFKITGDGVLTCDSNEKKLADVAHAYSGYVYDRNQDAPTTVSKVDDEPVLTVVADVSDECEQIGCTERATFDVTGIGMVDSFSLSMCEQHARACAENDADKNTFWTITPKRNAA